MSRVGAPRGNKNGAKAKIWEQALKRALARAYGTVDAGLDKLADQIVSEAAGGDKESREEIFVRMDGKPAQSVDMTLNDERAGRNELVEELATLHARLAGRSDGRGVEPNTGPVPSGGTTH